MIFLPHKPSLRVLLLVRLRPSVCFRDLSSVPRVAWRAQSLWGISCGSNEVLFSLSPFGGENLGDSYLDLRSCLEVETVVGLLDVSASHLKAPGS